MRLRPIRRSAPTSRYWTLQRQLTRLNTFLFDKTGGKVGGSYFGRKSGEAP